MCLHKLTSLVLERNFPKRLLYAAMQTYFSERILRAGEMVGQSMQPTYGILAGLSLGKMFARKVLYKLLECFDNTLPAQPPATVETRQFVDDLTTMSAANGEDDVTHTICSFALDLRDELENRKLTLSRSKSMIVSNRKRLGEESAKNNEIKRLPLSSGERSAGLWNRLAEDDARPATEGSALQDVGEKRQKCWHGKVAKRSSSTPQAFCFPSPTEWSNMSCRPQISNNFEAQQRHVRVWVATRLAPSPPLRLGLGWDSSTTPPSKRASAFSLGDSASGTSIGNCNNLFERHGSGPTRRFAKCRWRPVHGSMSGVVTTLLDLGWTLHEPDQLKSLAGEWWEYTGGTSTNILDEIHRCTENMKWTEASTHCDGTELEHGVVMCGFHKQYDWLVRQYLHGESCGGGWIVACCKISDERYDGLCPRCLAERVETEETMNDTWSMAMLLQLHERAAWFPKHGQLWEETKPLLAPWAVRRDPRLRGAGWSIACLKQNAGLKEACHGSVPGRQTVPRALLILAENIDTGHNASFGSRAFGAATLQRRCWKSVAPRFSTCEATRLLARWRTVQNALC